MNNHKVVMISIFVFLEYDKNDFIFFLENMHENIVGFVNMHEDKHIFVFCF